MAESKFPKNRRGQTMMIVGIIVLLVSFAVILFFIFRLNLGSQSNSEVCRNSVLLQAKGTKYFGNSLQCKTDYVCISGGGKCDNMTTSITINVDPTDKNQIFKAIADQMANCWYTFGEGQLNWLGPSVNGARLCAVCSVIGFDPTIQQTKPFHTLQDCLSFYKDTVGGPQVCGAMFSTSTPYTQVFTYREFIDYLGNTQKTQAQTYLQYLYGVNLQDFVNQPAVASFYNSYSISTGDQFSILTGRATGPLFNLFGSGTIDSQAVVLLKTTDISNDMVDSKGNSLCSEFVTQAS